jgi:TonB family protein
VFLRKAGVLLVAAGMALGTNVVRVQSQETGTEIVRRAKSKVQPTYPDLARKMNITGTVKVAVVVSPNGTVKDAKVLGGHPVLASAALEAARKWRFEPAAMETSGVVDFKFEGHD